MWHNPRRCILTLSHIQNLAIGLNIALPWSTRELYSSLHYEHDVKQDFSLSSRILSRTIAGTLTSHFHGRFLLGAFARESTISITHTKCSAPGFSLRLMSPVLLPSRFSGLLPRSHLYTLNKRCWNVRHKLQMPLLYGWYPLKKPLRAG